MSARLTQAQLLFTISRPSAWIIAPIIWFSGVTHSGTHALTVPGVLFAAALSFPICLSKNSRYMLFPVSKFLTRSKVTFGVNDVYDYDSDCQNRRKNNRWADGTVLYPVNHNFVLRAARVSTVVVVLLALPAWARSPQLFGCTVAFLSLVWIYSLPPLRLKERPVLDSLSNGLMCWLFWACGYAFNGDTSLIFDTKLAARNGRLVFLLASALHSLAARLDARADASAKYRTIATVLGEIFAGLFSLICLWVFLSRFWTATDWFIVQRQCHVRSWPVVLCWHSHLCWCTHYDGTFDCSRYGGSYGSINFRRIISWLDHVGAENDVEGPKGQGCKWKLVKAT